MSSDSLIDAARLRELLSEDGQVFSAGHAVYPGDQRHIVGEIKGPRTYGGYAVAVNAEYDADEDRTYVAFVSCPPDVLSRSVVDEFGIRTVGQAAVTA